MAVSDDSLINTWERHLAGIQENIDQYISSHYQPPYVEHDLDLEDECDEDELVTVSSIGAMPKQAFLTEERCFSSEEDASSLPEHLGIDDFLQQQGETFSQIDCQKTMLLREDIRAAGELAGSRAVTEPQRDKARLKLSTAGKSTCGAFLCCAVRLNTRLTGRAGSFCIHSRRAQVRRCARARRGGKAMQTALNSPRCLPVRSEVPTAHG